MTRLWIDKNLIIENLEYRIGIYHPGATVRVGVGNTNADVVVVQPHARMPERDSITGALKRFGMLSDSYRATSVILEYDDPSDIVYPDLLRSDKQPTLEGMNHYYLRELIEIINPLIVIACGADVLALLREKKVRSFKSHTGKKFKPSRLTKPVCYATLNPMEYGFASAPTHLKEQGKAEWEQIAKLYKQLKAKQEKERW